MASNWQTVTIPTGATSATVDIPLDEISAPPGRIRKSDGSRWSGNERPRFHLEEDGAGTKIVLAQPAPEDIHVEVKAETP